MTDEQEADRLYRAWAESTADASFDDEAGRTRFLSALHERRGAKARARIRPMMFAAAATLALAAALFFVIRSRHAPGEAARRFLPDLLRR